MNHPRKHSKKALALIITIIAALAITAVIFAVVNTPQNRDQKMQELATQYYEEKIKGKVIGINKHIVTLKALSDSGYDTSVFKNCSPESHAYVIIENHLEGDKDKINYSIENHLNCP